VGSYYKKRKGAGGPRHVTRAAWLYHETLPDLLPAIREQGLRPLRDVASRLARDAAEKAAVDAGLEVDPGFVHLYASEGALGLALLCGEAAVLRMRTSGLDPAFLTRDPRCVLGRLRAEDPVPDIVRREIVARLGLPGDTLLAIRDRLAARDTAAALDLLTPFVDAMPERPWEASPIAGTYRYAGIIPAGSLQLLVEFPAELAAVTSIRQAMEVPLRLDSRRWAPLPTADLAAAARGLGRTEFPADA
jgi:hypothetical protein